MNGTLDKDQAAAVDMALREKVMIVTGGPGTGKTFTLNHILDALDLPPHAVALAAPTGKAAKRMSEATDGRPAQTIHRLLDYSPRAGCFLRGRQFPLSADLIVIDESSMIDVRLMDSLMAAVPNRARLILIGDKDQLPPVGAGNVFRDLIVSGLIPVAHLTQIHRQSEHSWISLNARHINQGIAPVIDPESEDFFVSFHAEAPDAKAAILDLMTREIPSRWGVGLSGVQLLCPVKKGVLGVAELNKELQGLLNPPDVGKAEYRGFRECDKVIHVRNNYELDVMNGEVGRITAIEDRMLFVEYPDKEVVYKHEDQDDLFLAYALTIHKSQGSEWPVVVVPIHSYNTFMLSRNLFYTAITRGKRAVYVVGNAKGLSTAVRNNASQKRFTGLVGHLKQAFNAAA